MHNLAYLSLGSNIEAEHCLPEAVRRLAAYGRVCAVSGVLESPALGDPAQANYLNVAILLETSFSAAELWDEVIPKIETGMERIRSADKYSARRIDIDLMLFNHQVIQHGRHRVPSPEILERPFVALTLAQIDPDYAHPETGQSLQAIVAALDASTCRPRPDVSIDLPPVSQS